MTDLKRLKSRNGVTGLAELADEVRELRAGDSSAFVLVVEIPPGDDLDGWESAGATWILTAFGSTPREAEVRAAIHAGPR
jgi:hypothetical protein